MAVASSASELEVDEGRDAFGRRAQDQQRRGAGERAERQRVEAREHPLDALKPCVNIEDVERLKRAAADVRISEELKRYIVDLVAATRSAAGVQLGASPRASLALMKTSQALALFEKHEFVTPEHIQRMSVPVIAHRLVMEPQARFSGQTARGVVEEVLKKIRVPA